MIDRSRCALCAGRRHSRPRRDVTVYKLTCPGEQASEPEQEEFKQILADCTFVDQHYGRKAAVDLDLVPKIIARRDATLARGKNMPERAVTAAALAADATARTPDAIKFSEADRYIRDADFEVDVRKIAQELGPGELEIDPPHLTVVSDTPSRGEFTPTPRMKHAHSETSDYLLGLDSDNL